MLFTAKGTKVHESLGAPALVMVGFDGR